MTNRPDPLDNIPNDLPDDGDDFGIPPAPEPVEFDFPLVSERSEADLEGFGLNMVDDARRLQVPLHRPRGRGPPVGEPPARRRLRSRSRHGTLPSAAGRQLGPRRGRGVLYHGVSRGTGHPRRLQTVAGRLPRGLVRAAQRREQPALTRSRSTLGRLAPLGGIRPSADAYRDRGNVLNRHPTLQ